jgi:hypothetical protein
MSGNGLTDLVLALLHAVAAPRRRRCGHRGGWHHRCQILAPAPPLQPSSSTMPPPRVLERPPSPSPDRWLTGRWNLRTLMTLRGVAGWCRVPSTVGLALTGLHRFKGLHHRAIRGRRREEKKKLMSAESW